MHYDPTDPSPPFYLSPKIQLTEVPGKDLGVIAREGIAKDEVIECCPTILLKYDKALRWSWLKRFYKAAVVTIFDDYLWWWRAKKNALLLGYGNLYNHSDAWNAVAYRKAGRKYIFVATRAIEPGEEITVHYGHIPFMFSPAEKSDS
ncbi:MAG: SET domain-containing protein-lysine N-methyltransferase [Bdellovibrionales bacterium]|nr:SET domain-containing protein-lysine N-methyltransferase [Bdellovibrionales bacterium]